MTNKSPKALKEQAQSLRLWGILDNWDELENQTWLPELIALQAQAKTKRGLERRRKQAQLGDFKSMADFDWSWPNEVPRERIESLFKLEFIEEKENIILVGESGVGKTMIAKNIAHHAVTQGYTARFVTALQLLNDLSSRDAGRSLIRVLKTYASPDILIIDEIGYLASTAEYANLLFEVITMRYEQKPIILTSNKSVTQWGEVFPGAACVVAMVDRLIHRAHIVSIQAKSFRLKEAQERNAVHKGSRKTAKAKRKDS